MSLSVVGIYLGDFSHKIDIGIEKLHPIQGTHWILCFHERYFDSYDKTASKNYLSLI